jgi:hypothetical protein
LRNVQFDDPGMACEFSLVTVLICAVTSNFLLREY